jgi:hypothetical protein
MRVMPGRRLTAGLIPFADALEALGRDGVLGRRHDEVPVGQIVGSLARARDFDGEFRLRNRELNGRWRSVAAVMARGVEPPVELIQLGELYFVVDGHHRVSVARALGRPSVTARVLQLCTVAYAMACLRLPDLPSKAAERRFLQRIPLPDAVRAQLWLDEPDQWARLADAAEAWAFRQSLTGRPLTDRDTLASAWWAEEVEPVLVRLRGNGAPARDVQIYATALGVRDRLGWTAWPSDLAEHVFDPAGRPRSVG